MAKADRADDGLVPPVTKRRKAVPVLVVDAEHVVGSRPTVWWQDRPKAESEFVGRVRARAVCGQLPTPVVVVLQDKTLAEAEEGVGGGVEVVHVWGSASPVPRCSRASQSRPLTRWNRPRRPPCQT